MYDCAESTESVHHFGPKILDGLSRNSHGVVGKPNRPKWRPDQPTPDLCLNSLSSIQQIAKFDLVTRKHVEWSEENCFPSEPVFVASPGAVEEDDGEASLMFDIKTSSLNGSFIPVLVLTDCILLLLGVILSSIISPEANISPFMLVLDAKTFKEIARANIPTSVHMDLHGHFIPAV